MNYISQVTLPDSSSYQVKDPYTLLFAVCETAAATAEKEITLSTYEQVEGLVIKVLFENANSAAAPELSVNGGTADPIYLYGGNISPWDAGEVVTLVWDGTYWRVCDYGKVEVVRL